MERVRIGMVGSGFAGRLHLNNYTKLRGLKTDIVAICSKDADLASVAKAYGIPDYYDDHRCVLERKDIDMVDLCISTDLHEAFCIETAQAGKHIICEKPLTGYFGKDRKEEHVGFAVSKDLMLKETLKGCDRVAQAVKENHVKFMYAENWIYSPPLAKLKSLIKVSGGTILDIRAEGSHSGSGAPYSRKWKTSGGG